MNTIITKIMNEIPIIKNEYFQIVNDIEPICEGHLLLFPKEGSKSFFTSKPCERERILDSLFNEFGTDYYFFEKGNAPFCTSFIDGTHCHFHIVPKKYFNVDILINFNNEVQPNYTGTISSINYMKSIINEVYLFYGEFGKSFFLKFPFEVSEKRFLRNRLLSQIKN